MSTYAFLLGVHVLGACIWAGGHLVLAVAVLPRALRERNAQRVLEFEAGYEQIGLPALLAQVVTGLWLAHVRLGAAANWFDGNPLARVVQLKLIFLGATVLLALHARLRLIPRLRDETLRPLGAHIVAVTVLAVFFVLAGVAFRVGGIG